jgi:hypothetical protein
MTGTRPPQPAELGRSCAPGGNIVAAVIRAAPTAAALYTCPPRPSVDAPEPDGSTRGPAGEASASPAD